MSLSRPPYCVKCAWDGRGAVGRASAYMQSVHLNPFMARHEITLDLCTVCGHLAGIDEGFRYQLAKQALKARARS